MHALPDFGLTSRAYSDLDRIADYTQQKWGATQAVKYIDSLVDCFQLLADAPNLGRTCDGVRPGLRRFEHERHVVFYRQRLDGIRISRVLHQSRLPELVPFPR